MKCNLRTTAETHEMDPNPAVLLASRLPEAGLGLLGHPARKGSLKMKLAEPGTEAAECRGHEKTLFEPLH